MDLFANLFSQISKSQESGGDLNLDLDSLQNMSNVKLDKARMNNRVALQNTRDRLRRKLEQKKKIIK